MEKIIKVFEKFVLDEQICFYEQQEYDGKMRYRKLSPMFAFENWEVYALPVTAGLMYAIVGLHGGKRVFYENESRVSGSLKSFCSAGRDLICKNSNSREVILYCPKDGLLKNITSSFKDVTLVYAYVSWIKYAGGVLDVCLQAPRFYCEHKFWLQTDDGYEAISKEDAELRIKNAKQSSLHLAFE